MSKQSIIEVSPKAANLINMYRDTQNEGINMMMEGISDVAFYIIQLRQMHPSVDNQKTLTILESLSGVREFIESLKQSE